jgi:hypothetical protein
MDIHNLPLKQTNNIINSVEIIGNKRTMRNAIIQKAHIKIGKLLDKNELDNIKENLGRMEQIIIKSVNFNNGILTIELIEKWSLIPVPMINQSGSYSNRGFVIYDNNFLGTLGTFAPGISWSNSILNYLIFFQNESLFSPDIGIKALLLKKSELVEFKRLNRIVDINEVHYNTYFITPIYRYKDQLFKVGPIYVDKTIYKKNTAILRDKSKGIFFRHIWNSFKSLDMMYDGFITNYDLYTLNNQNSKMVYLNEANINWSKPTNSNYLNFGIHGYYSSESAYLFSKDLGGDEGYRGYDKSSLPVSKNIGTFVQYQQHVFNRIFISPFYEFNSSKLINPILNGRILNEHTIGIGIRYYFLKISIPAVIFDIGRNINDNSTHFNLNIGLSI